MIRHVGPPRQAIGRGDRRRADADRRANYPDGAPMERLAAPDSEEADLAEVIDRLATAMGAPTETAGPGTGGGP